jgi:PPOX class probable FMN-dependent enzyme
MSASDHLITTVAQLELLYGERNPAAIVKEIDHINGSYRKLIEAAPFVAVATGGPEGLDCSPKGDARGFVRVLDEKTLAIPDRPGNNRLDGFRNILCDPHIALLFLIPGIGETMRVNGRASISIDPELMQSFAVNGKLPRCVLIVHVETAYFHCSKAIVRSKLWDAETKIDRKSLPSTGTIVAELSQGKLGGEKYDREAPEKIKAQLY